LLPKYRENSDMSQAELMVDEGKSGFGWDPE